MIDHETLRKLRELKLDGGRAARTVGTSRIFWGDASGRPRGPIAA